MQTHEVFNQVLPISSVNLLDLDQPLQDLMSRHDLEWARKELAFYGGLMGDRTWMDRGHMANMYPPVFRSHDANGRRVDRVDYHPSYHEIMQLAIQHKLHSWPWSSKKKGTHLARMIKYYLHAQNEAGTGCPLTMTFSCVPAIRNHLPQANEWLPGILSEQYDPDDKVYHEKKGLTIGMAMTEKQGGTDVRSNTTEAISLSRSGPGELYRLSGHKWFCSAPMCDAFLTLAQTPRGLSCFLFPRWKQDGSKNHYRIQRLKDKLGNRSNASSEIEYEGAHAWLMGAEGRGVPTIIEMVGLTRYDCMIGSSALMRRAVTEVVHHISHRKVMGALLSDQPLMTNVVADLCLESEAALALTFRAAICLDQNNDEERLLLRLLLPVGKYWITKRAEVLLAEAMECLGGNGYVEDSILPRLYREAPVNAIWEGSGNVQCLDVLRAISRSPEVLDVYLGELSSVQGLNKDYDLFLVKLKNELPSLSSQESNARKLTERLALAMQAAQLLKSQNGLVSEAFCKARLTNNTQGWLFGTLDKDIKCQVIVNRYIVSMNV